MPIFFSVTALSVAIFKINSKVFDWFGAKFALYKLGEFISVGRIAGVVQDEICELSHCTSLLNCLEGLLAPTLCGIETELVSRYIDRMYRLATSIIAGISIS